jgi:hypothetical protein
MGKGFKRTKLPYRHSIAVTDGRGEEEDYDVLRSVTSVTKYQALALSSIFRIPRPKTDTSDRRRY